MGSRAFVAAAQSCSGISQLGSATSIINLPQNVNITMMAGDDFAMTLTLTNSDGSATNLSGATVKAQIKSNATDSSPVATFTPSITGNQIMLQLADTATQNLLGPYVYDCQVTLLNGTVSTIIAGSITFNQDVTR